MEQLAGSSGSSHRRPTAVRQLVGAPKYDFVAAAQQLVADSSAEQGLPECIDDPAVVGKIARILLDDRAERENSESSAAA